MYNKIYTEWNMPLRLKTGSDRCLFGYVKPLKPEMKIKEFEAYQAVYCGLCKQMGRLYGPLSRATLSYDITFLSLVALSLREEGGRFQQQRCAAHPLKKKLCACSCDDLSFGAHIAVLMVYYKLKDNIADSGPLGRIKYTLLFPPVAHARKKTLRVLPQVDSMIAEQMAQQSRFEQEGVRSVDKACDPTARALGLIFEELSRDEREKRILYQVGYMTGKFVYLADALDDLPDDSRTGSYNPYLAKFGCPHPSEEQLREIDSYAAEMINITVAQLAAAYELLELKRFKPILDNIIYLGFKHTYRLIVDKREKHNDRSVSNLRN